MRKMTAIPQNYKSQVEWVFGAYQDADVSLANGFQKDAIQNALGARKVNKYSNFSCEISVVETIKGRFLIVEDCGTLGLTGDNISSEAINTLIASGQTLGTKERLSRFTSMNNSGGNETGGGLYGVGKIVYTIASEDYTYYFDSFREDGIYVANVNKKGQVYPIAYENQEAKNFIKEETGLDAKERVGTRIIITNPKEELLKSIEMGEFQQFIQESWWITISKFDESSYIAVNGEKVTVPERIKKTNKKYEISVPTQYRSGYRVKKMGIYILDEKIKGWSGISYYRKGMKIGAVQLKDCPDKVKDKYWGYIEVDTEWEDELAKIEDKVHFGVSKGKKLNSAYQNLKNFCEEKFTIFMKEQGYIKDKEYEDKKLKEEMSRIATDIQDLFDTLGYDNLGTGPKKPDFDVRWKNVRYPHLNSLMVSEGDELKFNVKISNFYTTKKVFNLNIAVIDPRTKKMIFELADKNINIGSGDNIDDEFSLVINKENSIKYEENRIRLRVKVVGSGKEKYKELPYFYDIEKPDNSRDEVTLFLHESSFPLEQSRRVNFGERIKDIAYRINNKRNCELKYKLNISVHNAEDKTYPKICDIESLEGSVQPFEEEITSQQLIIEFDESLYSRYLTAGVLEIRARLIAREDSEVYEKGDRITSYTYKVFLNEDEKNGKRNSFETRSEDDPENYKRSWYEKDGHNRTIYLNVGHNAYKLITGQDLSAQINYIREQFLKQYTLIYLSEGVYDMFCSDGESFEDLDKLTVTEYVINKIEEIYYDSLR